MALPQHLLEGVIGIFVYACCSYGDWYWYVAQRSVPTMVAILANVGI